jgi:hypothetical protein
MACRSSSDTTVRLRRFRVEHSRLAYVAILVLTGETDRVRVQTRWKDRGSAPRIVEVSHLSRTEQAQPAATEGEAAGERPPGLDA